jgi:23S rRNA (uridine2552-2'-O)-methyltransferase
VGKSRTKSSRRWLERQRSDPYTQQAKQQGYRSRAAFKLLEIQLKDNILRKGMNVVDLGAAPGGWSQVTSKLIGRSGTIIALDILPIEPLDGVDIVQGDFQEDEVFEQLTALLKGKRIDLVISDMAPNLSGINAVDQPRSVYLAELALSFAQSVLVKGGALLVKLFQGEGFETYWSMLKEQFDYVVIRKPKSSRAESREVYLLAKGFISNEMRG